MIISSSWWYRFARQMQKYCIFLHTHLNGIWQKVKWESHRLEKKLLNSLNSSSSVTLQTSGINSDSASLSVIGKVLPGETAYWSWALFFYQIQPQKSKFWIVHYEYTDTTEKFSLFTSFQRMNSFIKIWGSLLIWNVRYIYILT